MPRLKSVDRKKMADTEMMAIISKYLTLRGLTRRDLARRILMPETTLYARCRNPGDFRREELMKIFNVLNVSEDDKDAIPW